MRQLSCVQLDSISTVERSHRIALGGRVGAFPRTAVSRLLGDGRLIEYWAHEACLLPMADYPYFRRLMLNREHHPWFEGILAEHGDLARQILRDIEAHGPSSARAYGGAGSGYSFLPAPGSPRCPRERSASADQWPRHPHHYSGPCSHLFCRRHHHGTLARTRTVL